MFHRPVRNFNSLRAKLWTVCPSVRFQCFGSTVASLGKKNLAACQAVNLDASSKSRNRPFWASSDQDDEDIWEPRQEMKDLSAKMKNLLAIPNSLVFSPSFESQCERIEEPEKDLQPEEEVKSIFSIEDYEQSMEVINSVQDLEYGKHRYFMENSNDVECHLLNYELIFFAVQLHHRIITEFLFNTPLQQKCLENNKKVYPIIDWKRLVRRWSSFEIPHPTLKSNHRLAGRQALDRGLYMHEIIEFCDLMNDEAMERWIQMLQLKWPNIHGTQFKTDLFRKILSNVMDPSSQVDAMAKCFPGHFELFTYVIDHWSDGGVPDISPDISSLLRDSDEHTTVLYIFFLMRFCSRGCNVQELLDALEQYLDSNPNFAKVLAQATESLANKGHVLTAQLIMDRLITRFENGKLNEVHDMARQYITKAAHSLLHAYSCSIDTKCKDWPTKWNSHTALAESFAHRLEKLGFLTYVKNSDREPEPMTCGGWQPIKINRDLSTSNWYIEHILP
jgi:hypothetical protein